MPEELPTSAQTSPEDGLKGQKMIIYLPPGAVIMERIDVEGHAQPVVPLIPERSNTGEYQMLCRIVEILESIAQRMGTNEQTHSVGVTTERIDIMAQAQPPVTIIPARTNTDEHAQPMGAGIASPEEGGDIHGTKKHHVDWTKKHHVDWMHFINFMFVAYLALISTAPAALSTYFGREVFVASSSNVHANIYRGDLMISKLVPASMLKVNEVVLLRNEETWNPEVHEVQAISSSSNGDSTTITTNSSNSTGSNSYSFNGATRIHEITSLISGIGDLSFVLSSVFTKIAVSSSLLIINIIVYRHRARRRRLNGK